MTTPTMRLTDASVTTATVDAVVVGTVSGDGGPRLASGGEEVEAAFDGALWLQLVVFAIVSLLVSHLIRIAFETLRPEVETLKGLLVQQAAFNDKLLGILIQLKAALAPLSGFPGAKALEDGHALTLKGGNVFVRQKGKHLVLGNDEAVVQTLLQALPDTGARLSHAVDFTADPKKVARGLSQVSLMDIMANPQLASLLAETDLTEIKVEKGDLRIRVARSAAVGRLRGIGKAAFDMRIDRAAEWGDLVRG